MNSVRMHVDNYIVSLTGEPKGDAPATGLYRKELVQMITWSDLIQFEIMLCAVVTLVYTLKRRK